MKYIYTKGPWKEYFGYVFFDGRPTEITDRATLERIQKEVDFKPYTPHKEIQDEETQAEAIEAQDTTPILKGKECSKCHQLIPRGWYFHQKWCRVIS